MELFPDIEKEDSALHRRMEQEMADVERQAPEAFQRPDWPTTIARYCAGCLGIKPKSIAEILLQSPDKSAMEWEKDPHFLDLVIRNATYTVGRIHVDVTRKLQFMIEKGALTVLCDDTLLPDPVDDVDTGREAGETGEEYWKRQITAIQASTHNDPTAKRILRVSYERQGEIHNVVVAQGEFLRIDPPASPLENSPSTAEKIAPKVSSPLAEVRK